jgi:hypothetical protein
MKKKHFFYDIITEYNRQRYAGILNHNNISSDEISIKNKEEETEEFFYPLKKDKVNYLLPSEQIELLPLKIIDTEKMSWRSKAYERIYSVKSIKITSLKTMSYKQFIDTFLPFEHESAEEFLIWKIVCDVGYRSRINIRAISYPGWLKDSPLVILSMLRGDVSTVNKPTFAKLKYLLAGKCKLLGMNEVQNIKAEEKQPLAKYYEDVGDFKPKFVADSRATHGTAEECDITNHSSMTFYNFPKKEDETLFDDVFDPKILSRIFPILLSGGSHERTACKEKFGLVEPVISSEDFDEMTEYLKNHVYFEENPLLENEAKKDWSHGFVFGNTRWQRNFDTICEGIRMYADTEEEFKTMCGTLHQMHENYIKYIRQRQNGNIGWGQEYVPQPILAKPMEINMSEFL